MLTSFRNNPLPLAESENNQILKAPKFFNKISLFHHDVTSYICKIAHTSFSILKDFTHSKRCNFLAKKNSVAQTPILFEITKDNLDTGLRGYPVSYCTTSSVDPMQGVLYVRKPVSVWASWQPERVIFLLLKGREPTEKELAIFVKDLHLRAKCSPETIKNIQALPRSGHPMKLFCAALHIAGMTESTGNYQEDCLNIIAKIPVLAALVIGHHAGWKVNTARDFSLGYIENFVHMLNIPNANKELLNKILEVFNVLHYDHSGGNLSTFVGKAVASGHEDMYGSLAAAMAALAGPLHGKANQDALELINEIIEKLGNDPDCQDVQNFIRLKLAERKPIFGFGHAVLRVEDSRATYLYQLGEEKFKDHPQVKIASLLRKIVPPILKEHPKIANPNPNVDAISGAILSAAGFPYPEYYTILFGLSRAVGIAIQIHHERCIAREGKGVPIYRPKTLYVDRV